MTKIQISALRTNFSRWRRCCGDGSPGPGRMMMTMAPVVLVPASMMRTFVATANITTTTTTIINNSYNSHNHYKTNNSMTPSLRFLSSSPMSDPKFPQPKKLILPSNLVIDPRSKFFTMYETESRVTDTPLDTAAPVEAAAVQEDDESWYDEEDDDDDDDEELFDYDGTLSSQYREGVVYTKPLPERLHVDIHSLFRSPSLVGNIHLNESVFGLDPIRIDLLKRSVDYYRAKKRGRRTAKTKTISEVSGSGRKIRKQKGGGVARAGHSRPPHYRGGAKAHGPKNNTDYGNVKLNKKVRQLATRHVLSQKLKEGNLIILNHMHELPTHKTNDLARILGAWKIGGLQGSSAIILDHYYHQSDDELTTPNRTTGANGSMPSSHAGIPTNLHAAARNIPGLKVANSCGANVYDILKYEKLLITLSAMEQLEARLKIY